MRRPILATTMGLLLTACAVPQQTTPGPGAGDWGSSGGDWQSGDGYRALSAYIIPPEQGGLRFHVSRPAYVAMFEIVPNGGTRLIYPTPGVGRMDGFVFSGTRVPDSGRYWRGDGYGDATYGGRGYAGNPDLDRPRFLFLIASERPLEIDEFGAYGSGLRAVLGHHYYASLNPYATMERLAEVALPTMIDDGTWATDMYVYWPQVLRQYRASRDVIVRCNGFTMYVAYDYAYHARHVLCGDRDRYRERERVARRRPPPRPREGGDSTDIEQPGRRAPLPPEAEAARRRLTSSRQLEQPQTQRPEGRGTVEGRATSAPAEPAAEDAPRRTPRRAQPGDGAPEADAPRAAEPESTPRERGSTGRLQPGATGAEPDAPRGSPRQADPAEPSARTRPEPPRTVRPAPEPRPARPVTAEPRRGGATTSPVEPGGTSRPRATGGDPTPAATSPAPASPAPASPPPASPPPASPPRQSTPAARPSPPPSPQRETGQEAPTKRRGGGGGGVDGG